MVRLFVMPICLVFARIVDLLFYSASLFVDVNRFQFRLLYTLM